MKEENMIHTHLKRLLILLFLLTMQWSHADTNETYSDPNRPIMVDKAAPTFSIKIQSNPTTGYSWFLQTYDNHLLIPVSRTYNSPKKAMPGAGGYEEWIFKVNSESFVVPQVTTVTLVYMRPWEPKEIKSAIFKIVIH